MSYYELTVLPSSLCMSVRIRTTVEQTNDVHYLLFLLKYIKSDYSYMCYNYMCTCLLLSVFVLLQ